MSVNSQETLRETFARDGVIGPFKLYEPEEAKEILKTVRIASLDGSSAIHQNDVGWDRHFDIPVLSRHIAQSRVVDRVRALLGDDVLCWRTEFFPKFPGAPGTDWHQVATFQYVTGVPILQPTIDGEDENVDVTVWTTFTEASIENGCMKFIPGSHKKKYYDESRPISIGRGEEYKSIDQQNFYGYDFEEFKVDPSWDPDAENVRSMEMNAGEFIMFSSKCVHGSHPNNSKRSTRFAISSRYVPTQVKVYPEHSKFFGHGGFFDLDASNYGCVVVSGEDRFGHNRLRDRNNHGDGFGS